jgi:hypothetical protein
VLQIPDGRVVPAKVFEVELSLRDFDVETIEHNPNICIESCEMDSSSRSVVTQYIHCSIINLLVEGSGLA